MARVAFALLLTALVLCVAAAPVKTSDKTEGIANVGGVGESGKDVPVDLGVMGDVPVDSDTLPGTVEPKTKKAGHHPGHISPKKILKGALVSGQIGTEELNELEAHQGRANRVIQKVIRHGSAENVETAGAAFKALQKNSPGEARQLMMDLPSAGRLVKVARKASRVPGAKPIPAAKTASGAPGMGDHPKKMHPNIKQLNKPPGKKLRPATGDQKPILRFAGAGGGFPKQPVNKHAIKNVFREERARSPHPGPHPAGRMGAPGMGPRAEKKSLFKKVGDFVGQKARKFKKPAAPPATQ